MMGENLNTPLSFSYTSLKTKYLSTWGSDALQNIKIESQNINSFSLSSADNYNPVLDKFNCKLTSILKNKPDIVLLQDTRIGEGFANNIIGKKLQLNMFGNFSIYSQSTSSSSRGTAVLINNRLNYEVFGIYRSECNNVILLDLNINGFNLQLVTFMVRYKKIVQLLSLTLKGSYMIFRMNTLWWEGTLIL